MSNSSAESANAPMLPEEASQDPELAFGDSDLMSPEAEMVPEMEPASLSQDADVPLDVEPDPDPEPGTEMRFDLATPEPTQDETLMPEGEISSGSETDLGIPDLRAEVGALQAEIDTLERKLREAEEKRTVELDKNRELQQKVESAAPAGELTRLQANLSESETCRKEAEADLTKTRDELGSVSTRLSKLESEVEERREEADGDEGTKREIDLMDAQIKALQDENTQLKDALQETQEAEKRTEHAHSELARKIEQLETEAEEAKKELSDELEKDEKNTVVIEKRDREISIARKEIADNKDAVAANDRKAKELEDRQAELDRMTGALAESQDEIKKLTELAAEADRAVELEQEAEDLSDSLDKKERLIIQLNERLDSEAARSYRLSQRRIPALNKELEDQKESGRSMRRRLQKTELERNTFEEQTRDLQASVDDLKQALTGAKSRLDDTQIIEPGDGKKTTFADDELRRLSNRLQEVEADRRNLVATFKTASDARTEELQQYEERAQRLSQESEDRLETMLSQRKRMKLMRERLSGMLKLAEGLSAEGGSRGDDALLDSMRRLSKPPATEKIPEHDEPDGAA